MNYNLNGNQNVEILGTPKTARLEGQWNGETFRAPLECWIAAMVEVLTPEQKARFFEILTKVNQQWEFQRERMADVRANIQMPNFKG